MVYIHYIHSITYLQHTGRVPVAPVQRGVLLDRVAPSARLDVTDIGQ